MLNSKNTQKNKEYQYYLLWWIVTVIMGTLFHFAYDVSNNNFFVGLFTPVNESVWEHLKLVALPIAIFSVFHYVLKKQDNFFASAISIILASFLILFIHYIFEILGIKNMTVDILSYIISMLIAFLFIYKTYLKNTKYKYIGISLLIITMTILAIFTVAPPHIQLFLDKTTNTYGIN